MAVIQEQSFYDSTVGYRDRGLGMLWWRLRWLGCLGSLILAVPVSSAVAAPAPVPFVPDVDTWVVTSAGFHRTYQIWVARPDGTSHTALVT